MACMSPYSDTRMCNQPGADSLSNSGTCHTRRHTHRHTQTHAHAPRGGGATTGPGRWPPSVAGWLPPCRRAFLGVSTVPRHRHPPHTRRHRARPTPRVRGHSWPRAECSGRSGEAGSAATGSQVVGCGVTWGGCARAHTHIHTATASLTHTQTHAIPCHSLRQSHRLTHSQIRASHRYSHSQRSR